MLQLIYYIALSPTPTTLTRDAQSINIHIHLTDTDHPNLAHILATISLKQYRSISYAHLKGELPARRKIIQSLSL